MTKYPVCVTWPVAALVAVSVLANAAACPAAEGPTTAPTDPPLEAKAAPYKGRNVFFVNGRPVAPQMYSGTEHSRQTWSGRPRQSLEEFTAAGYQVIQTDMWFKYSLRPDGTFDMEGVRRQLAGILEVNPRAMIVVRINVSAPAWWLAAHEDQRCRITQPNVDKVVFGGNWAESLASEPYAAFAESSLKRFLQELSRLSESARVIGFHIGGGVYGEWHYYGIYQEPDASQPMRRRFAAFARGRYQDIGRINAAWRTALKSFDEVEVPSYDRRYQVGDGDFRDGQADRYVIDYYQCQQETVSALVTRLAKAVKETWPRPTLVGLFYGYFFGRWTVGAQSSQFDIRTLFNSPYVDYFSGPYHSRNMHGSGIFRSLADSVALHGKVWVSEHDGGTHLGDIQHTRFPDAPRSEAESIARMRRNFMYALTENAGQWWYDFGPDNRSGWWSTPAMMAEARHLLALAREQMERPYHKPADVLVVYDMESFNHVRPARVDRLTFKITESMTDTLLGTGAAIDRIFLMDLDRMDLARYRLVIFANTFVLDAAMRRSVRTRVVGPGRSVVFMSGAGYCDGRHNDAAFISELTGIRIEKSPPLREGRVRVEIAGAAGDLDTAGVTTAFQVADDKAQPLGAYKSGATAAAGKTVDGAQVYYFGVPLKAPLAVLKALLARSGVRTYVDATVEQDYVSVGGGIIGIYSVRGGPKTIKPLNGPPVKVDLPPFSTRYFDIRDGKSLDMSQ